MKNKSFIGIDISKNVIDVSIFCEGTPIKDFPHDVFNNSRKIWRNVHMAQEESCGSLELSLWNGVHRQLLHGTGEVS